MEMELELKKCKNKKCQRVLPEGYKHKYCEHCRTMRASQFKENGKKALNVALFVGGAVVTIATKGNVNLTKKK